MRYFLGLLLMLASFTACKQKASISDRTHLESELIKTMDEYLQQHNAKPGVSFKVTDVVFFSEKDHHTCEFNVTMHFDNKDTVGKMKALISNDLSKVTRIY